MTDPAARPVADLHVHTTASDGQLSLAQVPRAAARAGLEAVAVTDHDRLHAGLDRPVERRDGVTIIRGIELKVEPPDGERVDLLGYAVEATDALVAELERLQADRMRRGERIVERVEERLDVTLDVEIAPGLGRPNIARAIARHPATDYDVRGAFAQLIGDDGPCYVAREVSSLEDGLRLLTRACPVVAVAHPLRYDDVPGALAVAREVGAVEVWYPYRAAVDRSPVRRAVAEHDLLPTGGSDAHDDTLGVAGLDEAAYARFRDACQIA